MAECRLVGRAWGGDQEEERPKDLGPLWAAVGGSLSYKSLEGGQRLSQQAWDGGWGGRCG